jgi:hypothetical protein
VQLLHFTKKTTGLEAFVYAGLCCFCTALHLAMVPPTGIANAVFTWFFLVLVFF